MRTVSSTLLLGADRFGAMRGSSSLPRLPPVKAGGDSPTTSTSNADVKLRKSVTSPFSTPALAKPRAKHESDALESPHTASSRDGKQRSSSYWANKFHDQSKGDLFHGDIAPLLERFEDTVLYRQPHRKSLQTVLDEMNVNAKGVHSQRVKARSCRSCVARPATSSCSIDSTDRVVSWTPPRPSSRRITTRRSRRRRWSPLRRWCRRGSSSTVRAANARHAATTATSPG